MSAGEPVVIVKEKFRAFIHFYSDIIALETERYEQIAHTVIYNVNSDKQFFFLNPFGGCDAIEFPAGRNGNPFGIVIRFGKRSAFIATHSEFYAFDAAFVFIYERSAVIAKFKRKTLYAHIVRL